MTAKLVDLEFHDAGWFDQKGIVFVISMMPILKPSGGALAGYWMKLPLLTTFMIAFAAYFMSVPIIIFFNEAILKFLEKHNVQTKFNHEFRDCSSHKSKVIQKMEFIGLMFFVGNPRSGSGAWTGSLIADTWQTDLKKAFLAIVSGVVLALVIMLVISFEVLNQVGL